MEELAKKLVADAVVGRGYHVYLGEFHDVKWWGFVEREMAEDYWACEVESVAVYDEEGEFSYSFTADQRRELASHLNYHMSLYHKF